MCSHVFDGIDLNFLISFSLNLPLISLSFDIYRPQAYLYLQHFQTFLRYWAAWLDPYNDFGIEISKNFAKHDAFAVFTIFFLHVV